MQKKTFSYKLTHTKIKKKNLFCFSLYYIIKIMPILVGLNNKLLIKFQYAKIYIYISAMFLFFILFNENKFKITNLIWLLLLLVKKKNFSYGVSNQV